MKFLILTILCNLLSSGQLQETNNDRNDYNLMPPGAAGKSDWPAKTFHANQGNDYGQAQRSGPTKPCLRRSPSESEPINQQLSPPLASKVDAITSTVAPLKPQALRNGDYDLQITNHEVPLPNSHLTKESNQLYERRNSLKISNPVIDSTEEHHQEILPTIRSGHDANSKPSNQMRSAPTSDSLAASSSGIKPIANRRDQPDSPNILRFEPNSEYGAEADNNYISELNNAVASEPNGLRSAQINQRSTGKSEFSPEFAVEPQTLSPELVAKLLSVRRGAEELQNKCSQDKEPDNLLGHSRRSMSSYNNEDNAKNTLNNDKAILRSDNDRYMEPRVDNEIALASVLSAEKKTVRSDKDEELKSSDKSKSPSPEKPVSRLGRTQMNEGRREMIEPTKGDGVVPMGQSALMLMQSERICYACSTANNPSCWSPDRKTTVKYCRKGNNACLTKTFGKGSTFTLIRDCGKTCDDSETGAITPRYKSCSICHSELCNGAYSINGPSIIFALLLIAAVKYFN